MTQDRSNSIRNNKVIPRDISDSLGKLPPQALDLEEAVLGAAILERAGLTQVVDILKPDDFYSEPHREIFTALIQLYQDNQPIDMRTVVNQLRKTGKLELVGGAYYVAELTTKVSSSENIEAHARVMMESSAKRKIILKSSDVTHRAYDDQTDVFELLDDLQVTLDEISGHYVKSNTKSAQEVYRQSVDHMIKSRNNTGLVGVPSGYTTLDRITGGWQAPELIIIAARPSMGKTAFVVNVARNAAVDFKIPVAIFSLEMANIQLMDRMIAAEAEIDLDKIRRGTYSDAEWSVVMNTTGRLSSAPIFMDDTAALSTLELRAKCRRLKAQHGINLIIVDYLQLMRGDKTGNREQEISSISRALKGIAKDLNTPVIALSQLSRSVETRGGDKRPMLADLRESGAIEQDADVVGFLYRPEYYQITVYEDGTPTQGTMEVLIAKNRNGACDQVRLKFIGKHSKVTEYDGNSGYSGPSGAMPKNTAQLPIVSFKDFQVSRSEFLNDDTPPPESTEEQPF